MDETNMPKKLMKIQITSEDIQCDPKNIDIGVAAKGLLAKLDILSKENLQFKNECYRFLVATVSKILERSPLKYNLTRAISCFVPGAIAHIRSSFEKMLDNFIQILYNGSWVSSVIADHAKSQFSKLCFKAADDWAELFNDFDWNEDRLDVFYYKIIGITEEFGELQYGVYASLR